MKHKAWWLVLLWACGAVALRAPAATPDLSAPETKAERDARMQWWRAARFGMFIHWGVYSVPAGTYNGKPIGDIGEWIMNNGKIPVAVYAKYAEQFNPVKFNADEWVSIARKAGMKYIVITSKHHDGFAMFHSRTSKYNIYDATPFKRDPLKELAAACRKQGIKLGFYYSQYQDWHHPGGGAYGNSWDEAQKGDLSEYVNKIAIPQVREILSNYGPIAVLWWDTPGDISQADIVKLHDLLKLQPGIVWNNRLGGGFSGDTETPEQYIPATGYPGRDWETCMTINDTWGYKSYDHNWKSTETLIRNLVDIASKGGNYLLNVGPSSEGLIPGPCVERLAEVGQWMKVNGEAIYATSASPFKRLSWGRCTQKPGLLYLHVFDWPKDGRLVVPGLYNKIKKAYLLADDGQAKLAIEEAEESAKVITVGEQAPDPVAAVVVLEIEGAADVRIPSVTQMADGAVLLLPVDADIHGTAQVENKAGQDNIGFWTDPSCFVTWQCKVTQPGQFEVEITSACEGQGGSEYTVSAGQESIKDTVAGTGGWDTFKTRKIGVLSIPAAGVVEIAVKPLNLKTAGVMNLRSLSLKPVPQ